VVDITIRRSNRRTIIEGKVDDDVHVFFVYLLLQMNEKKKKKMMIQKKNLKQISQAQYCWDLTKNSLFL